MEDVGIFTPTRWRRDWAKRLADAVENTAVLSTRLILAVDEDDDSYDGVTWPSRTEVVRGPRKTCGEWTNELAAKRGPEFRCVASFGDDHVPETPGWDSIMLQAIDRLGGTGVAYGNDTVQGVNLPTAPVMSSDIPFKLGWMFFPGWRYFCDNVWKDLAEPELLAYLPDVTIRHLHYGFGLAPRDRTYAEAESGWFRDEAEYHYWRGRGLAKCREKIREVLCLPGPS